METTIQNLDDLEQLLAQHIHKQQGSIMIYVGGIPQVSKSNDIVGNSLQEWLPAWFKDNGLNLTPNEQTQAFPDFVAHFDDHDVDMDIKCWNFTNSPAFDIANFDSFYVTMYKNPNKIMAKYLVIGYLPNEHGFTIEYVGLKNIWDLMGSTKSKPLNLQLKKGRPYAIRPINFQKNPNAAFGNVEDVLQAVVKTRENHPLTEVSFTPNDWYEKVKNTFTDNGFI